MKTTKIYDLVKNVCNAAGINAGFINLTVDPKAIRHYKKIDGLDVSKVTTLIEAVTISQIKAYGVDPAAYGIKNSDGLAGRFDGTRNYIFPLYALEKLFSSEDYARFYENYSKAVIDRYDVKTVKAPAKADTEKKESKILSITKALIAPTSKRVIKADTVKADQKVLEKAEAEEQKQEKAPVQKVLDIKKSKKVLEKVLTPEVKAQIWQEVKAAKADPVVKAEDPKAEEVKIIEPTVTKSVTIDSAYLDNLTKKAPAKKSKKAGKKADQHSYELLFS